VHHFDHRVVALDARAQKRGNRLRPGAQQRPTAGRHPQQLADHHRRQRVAEVADRLDLPGRLDGVDQLVGDRLDARAKILDQARLEAGVEQVPQPPVLGWVQADHPQRQKLKDRCPFLLEFLGERGQHAGIDAPRRDTRVLQSGFDIRVASQHPAVEDRAAVDWGGGPHLVVHRVGIGLGCGAQQRVGVGHGEGWSGHGQTPFFRLCQIAGAASRLFRIWGRVE
jgi:hypothetical protein